MGKTGATPSPWSFSRIKAFEQCPRQFYELKVLRKYPQEETAAMLYGTQFHEAAELYVRDGTPLPERFTFAKEALDALTRKPGDKLCEHEMGLTKNLDPCAFDDEKVWFRGIADLMIVDRSQRLAWVIDYKTGGNANWADKGQLELMALATFKHFPEVDVVRAGLLFVVINKLVKDKYTRKDSHLLWQKWLPKYNGMETAFINNVWNTRPSGLCKRHCPVQDCPHNGMN